ncbi:MAG: PAS domain-containing protein, partial [Verrucomicrobiota bacterium]
MKKERLPSPPLNALFVHAPGQISDTLLGYLRESKLRTFVVEHTETLKGALDKIKSGHWDVILMDLNLPDKQGIACFDEVHRATNLPVVIVVDTDFEDTAVEAVQSGAQEYVVATLTTQRALVRAVLYAVTKAQDARALALQRQLLDNLMLNTPDRIFFKDLQSRFIRISRATTEHFRLSNPDKAIGKTDFDFFTDEHAREAYEDEQEILKTGTPIIGKVEKETFDDESIRWALTTKMPLLNEEGEVIGTFGISRDFTNQKNMEDALEQERNRLNELTEELREKNLILEDDMHMAREVQQALIPQEYRSLKGGHFGEIKLH